MKLTTFLILISLFLFACSNDKDSEQFAEDIRTEWHYVDSMFWDGIARVDIRNFQLTFKETSFEMNIEESIKIDRVITETNEQTITGSYTHVHPDIQLVADDYNIYVRVINVGSRLYGLRLYGQEYFDKELFFSVGEKN